jgi:hypothetical protein
LICTSRRQVYRLELDGELPEEATGYPGAWSIERAWVVTPGHHLEGKELRYRPTLAWLKRTFAAEIEEAIKQYRQAALDEARIEQYEEDKLFAE